MKHLLSILCLLIFSCDSGGGDAPEIEGCTDDLACNYNPDATISVDSNCLYNIADCIEGVWIAKTILVIDGDEEPPYEEIFSFDYSEIEVRGFQLGNNGYWFNLIPYEYEEGDDIQDCDGGYLCEEEGNYTFDSETDILSTCEETGEFTCVNRTVQIDGNHMILEWGIINGWPLWITLDLERYTGPVGDDD